MWLFLAQEVMFFGGLFMAYAIYRFKYFDAWFAGSQSLSVWIGGFNTVVLLFSSFTMAMGVYYCQVGNSKWLFRMLGATLGLGIAFVVIKWFFEYQPKIAEGVFPGALWGPHGHYADLAQVANQGGLQLFFVLYYIMTGMHALHMIIGFGILLVLMWMAKRDKFGPQRYMPILFFGLYWHFVDIVWVFLFPMFYLVT
ncbi:MAG: cytochrome c oxidase subunit 3 [Candidatus Hydrogenedentes bacterium]|nr:cytochrome c oxidase subunit 3 [Candidatus Hydrogenedentota bacterium]